jgi:tyrosyl-tRNA synthetase
MSKNFNEILNDISHIVSKKKSFKYKLKNGLFNIYWGVTISHNLDFKLLFIFNKIINLIKIGHNITILIADIHTILDTNNNVNDSYTTLFIENIENLIKSYNLSDVELSRIKLIKGSQFQLSKEYLLDLFKLISINGTIKEYCDEFDLDINTISFTNVLHPLLQSLDEEHIKQISCNEIDCQIGYSDNIKQYVFSKKKMVQLGFTSKTYLLYDLPKCFITNPLYLNTTTFIPIINTLDKNVLLFIIDTLLESFKLLNKQTEEIEKEKESLTYMSNEELCDTIIRYISVLKL